MSVEMATLKSWVHRVWLSKEWANGEQQWLNGLDWIPSFFLQNVHIDSPFFIYIWMKYLQIIESVNFPYSLGPTNNISNTIMSWPYKNRINEVAKRGTKKKKKTKKNVTYYFVARWQNKTLILFGVRTKSSRSTKQLYLVNKTQ